MARKREDGNTSLKYRKVAPNEDCRKEIAGETHVVQLIAGETHVVQLIAGETPTVLVVQQWLASSTNLRSIAILLWTQVFR